MQPRAVLLALLVLGTPLAARAAPRLSAPAGPVSQYARIAFEGAADGTWQDPYDSDQVRADLHLTTPSGHALVLPCYWDAGAWRARFTPIEAGRYTATLVVASGANAPASPAVTVEVQAAPGHGFLHPADAWSFRFDDGTRFRGIGENIGWESRAHDDSRYFSKINESPVFTYDYLLVRLRDNRGNFFRTWMCPWNLPLEWHHPVNTTRYRDDPGRFNASAAERLDHLCDVAASTDTYFMLTLVPHVDLMGDAWAASPYNRANGGPAATPGEFFTNPAARHRFRDFLRHMVARWGWSTHVGAWEFFNEVDNAMYGQSPVRIPDAPVAAWHAEMAAYLKSIDPYGHLVTTSISHREVEGMNAAPGLDFTQRHIYRNTLGIPDAIRAAEARFGKPAVIGEYAYEWDWSKDFSLFEGQMERDFRRGLWLGLFSPTPILPMSWWWEFFDPREAVHWMRQVRALSDEMLAGGPLREVTLPWDEGPFIAVTAIVSGKTTYVLLSNESGVRTCGRLGGLPPGARPRLIDRDFGDQGLVGPVGADGRLLVCVDFQSDEVLVITPSRP
jgi:Domain of unknown function (DUF5060)